MYADSITYTTVPSQVFCKVAVDIRECTGKEWSKIINMLLRYLKILLLGCIILKLKPMVLVFPQSLMGSDKRPTDVRIFPEGIHHISYACSLCFHISGDGEGKFVAFKCTPLDDVNNSQPFRNIFWAFSSLKVRPAWLDNTAAEKQTWADSQRNKTDTFPPESSPAHLQKNRQTAKTQIPTARVSPPGSSAGPQLVLSGSMSATHRVRMQPFHRP